VRAGSLGATVLFRLLRALRLDGGLHVGIEQSAMPVGRADLGGGQAAGSAEVCARETCAMEVGIAQDGTGKQRALQVSGLQVGIEKDRAFELGAI